MHLPVVHTMFWDNIPAGILKIQQTVFSHLELPLQQERADRKPHGVWMSEVLERHDSDDIVVFCDIDAFPLNRQAYLQAVAHARDGALFGLAQFSNHKPGNEVYAGPMFMALRKSLWETMGQPDLKSSKLHDAAEVISALARQRDIPLVLCPPTACLIPKWSLGNEGVFGIGSFYGTHEFFHLFESRKPAYEALLDAVAHDVTHDRPLNFEHYLALAQGLQSAPASPPRNWWQRLRSR
ncbi:MAG TPA: hypothetical protein PK925_12170 [Alicycliphilus sp.]|nr:hypothetical protein [Alicycliphilus sp.]